MADLTPKQTAFVAAMLAETNVRRACERAGVAERTAWRWLTTNETVKAEIRTRTQAALRAAEDTLRGMSAEAAGHVLAIMREADTDSTRLRAALACIEIARATALGEIEERIAALEKREKRSTDHDTN